MLDLALQAERPLRFAMAHEQLRRAIALDGGPATLDARLKLGRLLIESEQDFDRDRSEADYGTVRKRLPPAQPSRDVIAS